MTPIFDFYTLEFVTCIPQTLPEAGGAPPMRIPVAYNRITNFSADPQSCPISFNYIRLERKRMIKPESGGSVFLWCTRDPQELLSVYKQSNWEFYG